MSGAGPERPGPRQVGPRWLMDEIGAFLADGGATIAERHAVARVALDHGRADFESFVDSRFTGDEVVSTEIGIVRGCGHECRFAFGSAPGPIALMVFCASNCVVGDQITVRQVTALGGSVTTSERWPFGLAVAEQLTVPAPARLAARRRCAEIGAVDGA